MKAAESFPGRKGAGRTPCPACPLWPLLRESQKRTSEGEDYWASRQTKHSDWLALLWAPDPGPIPLLSLQPTLSDLQDWQPLHTSCDGWREVRVQQQSSFWSLRKRRTVSTFPSGRSAMRCQRLQMSPALQLHRERKGNRSLESPELFPLIGFSPFLIQMSAAPGCSEPPLKVLCGAIPWSLFFPAQETELSQPWAPFAFLLWRVVGSLLSHTIFSHIDLLDCLWDKYCCYLHKRETDVLKGPVTWTAEIISAGAQDWTPASDSKICDWLTELRLGPWLRAGVCCGRQIS